MQNKKDEIFNNNNNKQIHNYYEKYIVQHCPEYEELSIKYEKLKSSIIDIYTVVGECEGHCNSKNNCNKECPFYNECDRKFSKISNFILQKIKEIN